MALQPSKYSDFLTPLALLADLLIINSIAYALPINLEAVILFHAYISVAWISIALWVKFYIVYRYSKVTHILRLLVSQFALYFLFIYAFIGFFKQPNMSRLALAQYVGLVFMIISILKFLIYYLLMEYRERVRSSVRRVVVIGDNKKATQLISVFQDRKEYGFEFVRQFFAKEDNFSLPECFDFILSESIDEIYCSISELSNKEIIQVINFSDNNL